MDLQYAWRRVTKMTLLAGLLAFGAQPAPAVVPITIYESATLGPTGQFGGYELSASQFLGSRFYLATETEITAIGGHIAEDITGNLFGAILKLSSISDLPVGSPFVAWQVAASTVFDGPLPSTDFRTPLSVTLPAGYYAVVFGSDELGASGGNGVMPYFGQTNISGATYIVWNGVGWFDAEPDPPPRFVVEGIVSYCEAWGFCGEEYISRVMVGTIDNATGCQDYSDFTSLSTTMELEAGYGITVENGYPYADDECGIWVDWNRDGDFDDAGETISPVSGSPGYGPYTATITPPAGASAGDTRLRIRISYGTPYSCGWQDYGEVEDYTITVGGATLKVSGHVTLSNGTPLSGVLLEAYNLPPMIPTGLTDISDANGYYEITLPSPWSGYIDPNKDHYGFSWGMVFENVTTDQIQDFGAYYTYSGGFGIAGSPYLIATAEDMNAVGDHLEDWDKYFKVVADINLSQYTGTEFSIIGTASDNAFSGVFDGNGHTISSFTYNSGGADYVGLFGYVIGPNAEIKNLALTDANVDAGTGDTVGSLVGRNDEGTISDCHSDGAVSGQDNVGGLVGANSGDNSMITGCSSGAVVSGTGRYVGGLAGANWGTVSGCYSTGNVSGDSKVGGLVGRNYEATVSESYSTGHVSGASRIGGLVGENYFDGLGTKGLITNCYARGSALGGETVGGLVGMNYCAEVSNCYSTGYVDGSGEGGLIASTYGCLSAVCSNSFWDVQASQMPFSYQGIGKTTAEMMQEATFTTWDFVNIWDICEGTNYPKLAWQIPLPGDFMCPDWVDMRDFSFFAGHWRASGCGDCGGADLDGDGDADEGDLRMLAGNWLGGIE
ncbi:MAG: GLUG motif-containing protein [Planctomycetota bacterium]|jgi:hypothetical protein